MQAGYQTGAVADSADFSRRSTLQVYSVSAWRCQAPPGTPSMKDLIRLAGYTVATLAMIFLLIKASDSGAMIYLAIFMVVVLPIAIGIFVARRAKPGAPGP
jgi:hypothetical protein